MRIQDQNVQVLSEVRALCAERRYDEAIERTNAIEPVTFAIRAHLLVMEHEQQWRIQSKRLLKESRNTLTQESM